MLIVISGPQGAGKSFAATLLRHAIPELFIVSGDEYILRERKRYEDLRNEILKLKEMQAPVIFEHVSAYNVLEKIGLRPDLVVFIFPEQDEDRSSCGPRSERRGDLLQRLKSSSKRASLAGIATFDVTSSAEAVATVVQCLQLQEKKSPVTTFILKVASRCNLSCSYCYMYEGSDQSWKSAPRAMPLSVVKNIGLRINEYAEWLGSNGKISLVLHGGEPLTVGESRLYEIIDTLRETLSDQVIYSIGIQTNGTLLSRDILRELDQRSVSVGISIDGFTSVSNARRPYLGGRSSLPKTLQAVKLLTEYSFVNGSFGGALAVLGADQDGAKFYADAKRYGLKALDLLFEGSPVAQKVVDRDCTHESSFLEGIFESWLADDDPIRLRLFESIIARLLGKNWNVDSLGFAPISLLGISVSGEWEFLDCLRLNDDESWKSPLNVGDSRVTDVMASPEALLIHTHKYGYAKSCVDCKYFSVCGSGYLPHRYRPDGGYENPSENCDAIYRIISSIDEKLSSQLS